ncbi:hypothetical protein [Sphaerisporangium rufum]|nr:hypothetical protein [Sphaerisporangium rufum]
MGRILLLAAGVVVAFLLLGSVIGFVVGALKWALIIGIVVLAVMALGRILRSTGS